MTEGRVLCRIGEDVCDARATTNKSAVVYTADMCVGCWR